MFAGRYYCDFCEDKGCRLFYCVNLRLKFDNDVLRGLVVGRNKVLVPCQSRLVLTKFYKTPHLKSIINIESFYGYRVLRIALFSLKCSINLSRKKNLCFKDTSKESGYNTLENRKIQCHICYFHRVGKGEEDIITQVTQKETTFAGILFSRHLSSSNCQR